jgi:predicted enzyme related to lactoylglutathione lyase
MSVKVDLDRLADALGDFTFAYLVTVGDDYRAHTVAVTPELIDGILDIGPVGNSTRRNATQHGDVTVTWPPREPGGYTLIVDGRAELSDTSMKVTPSRAVLHRPASPDSPASTTGCLHDCVPLDDTLRIGAGATRVVADLPVADIEAAKSFYTDYLGLRTEEFNMGWVARYTAPGTGAIVQLVTRDASAPQNPVTSVFVDDIDAAYADARRRGYEIVHPLTTEPWGVRRFFVRAPDGTVHNIVNHRD